MISSVVISDRLYRSSIVVRRLAYTDATPASTSASVWNALVGVNASCGTSVRLVQPLKMIGAGPQSSSAPRVIRPIDQEKIFLICLVTRDCRRKSGAIGARLEGNVCASRERAGSRIRQVIDAARRHAVDAGVGEHFGIVAGVRREQEQVVARQIVARRAAAAEARQSEGVPDRGVLQANEAPVLDP